MSVAKNRTAAVAAGVRLIAIDDLLYPALLREIRDPPNLLYVRGDPVLLGRAQIAVVGSRRASSAALRLAHRLSGELVTAGLQVCSGLALGIDGAAHQGALAAGGYSIGVMATGIDRVYPRRHRSLAENLQRGGCLVTEFPPGTPPRRHNFPRRNRIISGLSLGVLVVEAALPSGSLITAGTAAEQGREVFALPWSALHERGRGCLQLIRDGACMVQNVDDILRELGPLYAVQQAACAGPVHSGDTERLDDSDLLALVGYEVVSLDELVAGSGRPVDRVLRELSALELAGQLEQVPGGYIRR